MVNKTCEAESIIIHYLFALGAYRGLYILNWIYRYYSEGFYDLIAFFAGLIQTVNVVVVLAVHVVIVATDKKEVIVATDKIEVIVATDKIEVNVSTDHQDVKDQKLQLSLDG